MMRSAPAWVAVLAGFLLIAAVSTAVAMSGTGEGNATASQYRADEGQGQVLDQGPDEGQGEVLSDRNSGGSGGSDQGDGGGDQNVRQLTAQEEGIERVAAQGTGGGLPFTGFAAIPLLLIGAGLLVTGVVTRRRLSGDAAE